MMIVLWRIWTDSLTFFASCHTSGKEDVLFVLITLSSSETCSMERERERERGGGGHACRGERRERERKQQRLKERFS